MTLKASNRLIKVIKIDFVRFCIVGGSGFLINLFLLTLLNRVLNTPIFLAQLVSAEVALFSNFMLHHHWTYKQNKVSKSKRVLFIQFHLTAWPAIFGSAIMVTIGEKVFHFDSTLALIFSSLIALLWNFVWSKYVVWRRVTNIEIQDIVDR